MTVTAVTLDETEAAAEEGLLRLTPEQDALRQKWLTLNALEQDIKEQKQKLRDELGAHLVEAGLQGLTVDGKVVVRLSNVTTVTLDAAKVKANHPKLFALLMKRYAKVTRSERMTIK